MLALKASVFAVTQTLRMKIIQEGNNVQISGNSTVHHYLPSLEVCILPFSPSSLNSVAYEADSSILCADPSFPRRGSLAFDLSSEI